MRRAVQSPSLAKKNPASSNRPGRSPSGSNSTRDSVPSSGSTITSAAVTPATGAPVAASATATSIRPNAPAAAGSGSMKKAASYPPAVSISAGTPLVLGRNRHGHQPRAEPQQHRNQRDAPRHGAGRTCQTANEKESPHKS